MVIVSRSADSARAPQAAPTPSTPVYSALLPTPSPAPLPIRGLDPTLFMIYSTARNSVPAQDVVRAGSSTGSCKSAKVGSRPKVRAANAVVNTLTRFTEIDAAVIVDNNAGLCSLQIRAADGAGVVAVVISTAPDGSARPSADFVHTGRGIVGGEAVEYVQYRSRQNWRVTVGVAGIESRLPARAVLRTLAQSTALRW